MSGVQFIKAKAPLSAKVGRLPTFDPQALARAEAALENLATQFDDWMTGEAEKLVAQRDLAKAAGWSDAALAVLFTSAHDIKGLGSTYKFPIASQVAGSLCRLLEAPRETLDRQLFIRLTNAHVETIRAIVRDRVREATHPIARALLAELAEQTRALFKAP